MGYATRKRERDYARILIGIPNNFSTYYGAFIKSIEQLQIDPSKIELIHAHIGSALIHDMRNKAIQQALKHKCTHLLMVDADGVIPSDLIVRLLAWRVDIVGATVWRRHPPFHPAAYHYNPKSHLYDPIAPDEWMESPDLYEVDAVGAAAILINTAVFDKLGDRAFSPITFESKGVTDMYGEDVSFCHRAREAGIKIHVDTTLTVGHLLQGVYIGPNGAIFLEENIAYVPAEVLGEAGPGWLRRYYGSAINNTCKPASEAGVVRVPGQPAQFTREERAAFRSKSTSPVEDRGSETGVDPGVLQTSDGSESSGDLSVRDVPPVGD